MTETLTTQQSEPKVFTAAVLTQFLRDIRTQQSDLIAKSAPIHAKVMELKLADLNDYMDQIYAASVPKLPSPEHIPNLQKDIARIFSVVAYMTQVPISYERILLDDISIGAIRLLMTIHDEQVAKDLAQSTSTDNVATETVETSEAVPVVH